MNNIRQLLTQFLIVFLLSTLIVTLYFIHSFHSLADTITFSAVVQTITQFGLIIAIPTAILFVLVDLLVDDVMVMMTQRLVMLVLYLMTNEFQFLLGASILMKEYTLYGLIVKTNLNCGFMTRMEKLDVRICYAI